MNLLVPKIRTGVFFYLIVVYFWNSKTISQLNFERLVLTDFRSNDFSEISPAYLLYPKKADTRNFSKKYQQNFLIEAIFFKH